MSTNERLRSRSSIRTPIVIFGTAMTLFYLGMGTYLFIDKSFLPGIPADFRSVFAGLLLIYGIYRGYRLYADHLQA
ncbi:MAG: hypothetical protein R3D58_23000 [Saprospiraceae bacterium]|nr:hypothetical protein [Lewinellaceae bacterium]